jgi:hypothetical protein
VRLVAVTGSERRCSLNTVVDVTYYDMQEQTGIELCNALPTLRLSDSCREVNTHTQQDVSAYHYKDENEIP